MRYFLCLLWFVAIVLVSFGFGLLVIATGLPVLLRGILGILWTTGAFLVSRKVYTWLLG